MDSKDIENLLKLAMSDSIVNWDLFHCYELEFKLSALDLYFSEYINSLPFNIVIKEKKRGSCGQYEITYFHVSTKLLFGLALTILPEVFDEKLQCITQGLDIQGEGLATMNGLKHVFEREIILRDNKFFE